MSNTQADKPTLTTRQGHPVHNNQQQRTVGSRGPATLVPRPSSKGYFRP